MGLFIANIFTMNESSREYLDKKRVLHEDEKGLKEAKRLLQKPLGQVSFDERGSVHLEQGPYAVRFQYERTSEPLSDIEKSELREATLYRAKEIILERKGTGATLNIDEIAKGYSIFFCRDFDEEDVSSYVVPESKRIVLIGEPTRFGTLLSLLHEIGHTYERELPKKFDLTRDTDLAEKLLAERNAWAYALRKMRPFLDESKDNPLSKRNVLLYAKQRALSTYVESINDELHHRAHMDHFARNMFPDQFEEYPEDDATGSVDVGWPVKPR